MGEARTQRYVAQQLQSSGITAVRVPHIYLAFTWHSYGYIVSEYIDGKMCDDSDIPGVAAAVQALISIPSPSSTPGPVGGGRIEHPFFVERTSSIWYESVEELQDHVNGVSVPPCLALSLSRLGCSPADDSTQILLYTGREGRVEFGQDIDDLRLCVSDLMLTNFMKDGAGGIVAVDFGGYSFLPDSFFIFELEDGCPSKLKHQLATVLKKPKSLTADVLVSASCALAPYSSNNVGEQISLLSFRFPASRTLTRILRSQGGSSPGLTRRTSRPSFRRTASSLLVTYVHAVMS